MSSFRKTVREGAIESRGAASFEPSSETMTSDWRGQKVSAVAVSTEAKRGRLGCTAIDQMASPAESGPDS